MIERSPRGVSLSLKKLKQLGDKRMADARQAITDAKRLAHETEELRAAVNRSRIAPVNRF